MSDVPLCKDCRWVKQVMLGRSDLMADCINPAVIPPSYVNGRPVLEMCAIVRRKGSLCGPSGRLFEPKTRPWWRFW